MVPTDANCIKKRLNHNRVTPTHSTTFDGVQKVFPLRIIIASDELCSGNVGTEAIVHLEGRGVADCTSAGQPRAATRQKGEAMAMTAKENYRAVLNGEWGEWIPITKGDCRWIVPTAFISYIFTPEKKDMFGVHWKLEEAGPMVDTTRPPAIDDLANWRDCVNLPDLDSIDWEAAAAKELAAIDPDDPFVIWVGGGNTGNIFLPIMNMMGFEEGLMSFYESPDDVHEFCEYMTQYYLRLIDIEERYYNPDVFCFGDDFCSAKGPFISMEMFDEFFRPYFQRMFDRVKSYGKKVEFHCCGKAESIVSALVDIGVDIWQVAQPINDLEVLKETYGKKLTFNGGWAADGPGCYAGADEETVRQQVRDCIDRMAAMGPFVFFGPIDGAGPAIEQQNQWKVDEVYKYGREVIARKKRDAA